jgi:hypothetical protein
MFSAVALGALLIGCSGGGATPAARSPSPSASWPPGGPVPSAIEGTWFFDTVPSRITIKGNLYTVTQRASLSAYGNVVVNGNEIDFFNGSGCRLALPDGVGRYWWSLGNKGLHFTLLNQEPCGRKEILADAMWTRTTTIPKLRTLETPASFPSS